MNRDLLKGILFVTGGAVSYGVLATIVRLAYNEGYTTAEATVSQYTTGLLVMGLLLLFRPEKRAQKGPKQRNGTASDQAGRDEPAGGRKPTAGDEPAGGSGPAAGRRQIVRLIGGGTAYGLTGVCYYMSVRYLPVSVCVILLMQTIWMGIVLDAVLRKKFPSPDKMIATVVVLVGTLLATNAIANPGQLNLQGIGWGLGAALTYTMSLFVANRIATKMSSRRKSFWILTGGTSVVLLAAFLQIVSGNHASGFQFPIYTKWGPLLALFGTILPPLLLNLGMPRTGMGLGSILISMEIPVSVVSAYVLLHEQVLAVQWAGIALMIAAVVLLNFRTLRQELTPPRK